MVLDVHVHDVISIRNPCSVKRLHVFALAYYFVVVFSFLLDNIILIVRQRLLLDTRRVYVHTVCDSPQEEQTTDMVLPWYYIEVKDTAGHPW